MEFYLIPDAYDIKPENFFTSVRTEIEARFGYDLRRAVADIRPAYTFKASFQGSAPESIIAFPDSNDYESRVINAISLGGEADIMTCIAGGIARHFTMKRRLKLLQRSGKS